MRKALRHFTKATNTLPNYMARNLKNMTNNKGYFWRGVAFYGKRPYNQRDSEYLFDRKKGGFFVTHEWTKNDYNIYTGRRNEKKKLYSSRKRTKKIY